MNVAQELKEAYIPRQVGFADPPQYPHIGLQQRKEALRPILMHVTTRVFLLRMVDERVHVGKRNEFVAYRVLGTHPVVLLSLSRLCYDASLTSRYSDRRHHSWPVY